MQTDMLKLLRVVSTPKWAGLKPA